MASNYKEILFSQVAPAIGVCLMTTCLSHNNLPIAVISAAVPGLAGIVVDAYKRRKAERFFEGIAIEVTHSLLPLFAAEGNDLDEPSRASLALLLANVLNRDNLNLKVIIENRLDSERLALEILRTVQSDMPQYSASEQYFFDRLIHECCKAIVGTASSLPAFSETTISKMLDNEAKTLEEVKGVLSFLENERSQKIQTDRSAAERFEADYRKALLKLDRIELFGLKTLPELHAYNLSMAYVTLAVEPSRKTVKPRDGDLLAASYRRSSIADIIADKDANERKGKMRSVTHATASRMTVEEVLSKSSKVLIRGLAGSGKTTLLQWVAVRAAKSDFTGRLEKLNGTIPFFIRLRRRIKPDYPRARLHLPALPDLIEEFLSFTSGMPADWIENQLTAGTAIVLIDGVDEVDRQGRSDLKVWINNLIERYPANRFVVTSRTHIAEDWLEDCGFASAEILSMLRSDINLFVDRWHEAAKHETTRKADREQLERYATNMKAILRRNSEIRRLAINPLLCSMLCALHRSGQQQLPDSRIDLYRECIDVLLHKRDIGAGVAVPDLAELTLAQKQSLLKTIAFEFMQNDLAEATTNRVQVWIEDVKTSISGLDQNLTAEAILETLIQRSGVIRQPEIGSVDFIHKTFQEFLAAQALLDRHNVAFFISNANDENWIEVLVLLVGMAPAALRTTYLEKLVEAAKRATFPETRKGYASVAAACLQLAPEIDPRLSAEILSLFEECVPPTSRTAAKFVARVGTPAVALLKNSALQSPSAIAMCIVALAHIGGEEAMEAISSISMQTESSARTEMLRAWDYFSREGYARTVLSNVLGEHGYLPIEMPLSLEGIGCATGIKQLVLTTPYGSRDRVDPTGFRELTTLESLAIEGRWSTFDLRHLVHNTSLQDLKLTYYRNFAHIEALQSHTTLRVLCLSKCSGLDSLVCLEHLHSLEELSLESAPCDDISPLKLLKNLRVLELRDFRDLRKIDDLATMTNLTHISLRGCREVRSVNKLLTLPKLKVLNLRSVHPSLDGVKFPQRPDVSIITHDGEPFNAMRVYSCDGGMSLQRPG